MDGTCNKCFIVKFLHGCVDIKALQAKLCVLKKTVGRRLTGTNVVPMLLRHMDVCKHNQ